MQDREQDRAFLGFVAVAMIFGVTGLASAFIAVMFLVIEHVLTR